MLDERCYQHQECVCSQEEQSLITECKIRDGTLSPTQGLYNALIDLNDDNICVAAVCLNHGANPNTYKERGRETVHMIVEMYNLNKDRSLLKLAIALLTHKGALLSAPAYMRSCESISVSEVVKDLDCASYDKSKLFALTGDLSLRTEEVPVETAVKARTEVLKYIDLKYEDLLLCVRYYNTMSFSIALSKGLLPKYLLMNTLILMLDDDEKCKRDEVSSMIVSSVRHGYEFDIEQWELLLITDKPTSERCVEAFREMRQPLKILEAEDGPAIRASPNCGEGPAIRASPNCGEGPAIRASPNCGEGPRPEALEVLEKRQCDRLNSKHRYVSEYQNDTLLTCSKEGYVKYPDIFTVSFRNSGEVVWYLSTDYVDILKGNIPTDERVRSEVEWKYNRLKRLGIDETQPMTFEEILFPKIYNDAHTTKKIERFLRHHPEAAEMKHKDLQELVPNISVCSLSRRHALATAAHEYCEANPNVEVGSFFDDCELRQEEKVYKPVGTFM